MFQMDEPNLTTMSDGTLHHGVVSDTRFTSFPRRLDRR